MGPFAMLEDAAHCSRSRMPNMDSVLQMEFTIPGEDQSFQRAMNFAREKAKENLEEFMLLSWYDRERDFESPQHVSECGLEGAVPGYLEYGVSRGATLMVNINNGKFVFLFAPAPI